MKKRIIIFLSAVAAIVAGYAVASQLEWFRASDEIGESIVSPGQFEDEISEDIVIPSQTSYLNIQELEKIEKTRDPFDVAPIVEKEYEKEEEKYKDLKDKIEKRIEELENENEDGSVEDLIREEVEKIVETESKKDKTRENVDRQNNGRAGAVTQDNAIIDLATSYGRTYNVDKQLVLAIIGNKKASDGNFESKHADDIYYRGMMELRSDEVAWLASELGVTYEENMVFDNKTNIEFGTYYLDHLRKQRNDIHFILTAYRLGELEAERIKETTGSYASEYSNMILSRMK